MSDPVDILGIGLLSCAGDGTQAAWKAICDRRDMRSQIHTREGPAFCYLSMERDIRLRLEIMAGIAIATSMVDASTRRTNLLDAVGGLCIGSSSAGFAEWEAGNGSYIPSNLITSIAHDMNTDAIAQFSNACSSSSAAIAHSVGLIRRGQYRTIIAGGADEVTETTVDAFRACRIYGDRCRPFDENRKGLVLGEAAAFMVLSKHQDGADPVGRILGVGLSSDASGMTGVNPEGIYQAIDSALEDAGRPVIDFVIAHGTGTEENDRAEDVAITRAFGCKPEVASYKGSLGHPQGASGAVGVSLMLEAIRRQKTFPTVGCVNRDVGIQSYVTRESRTLRVGAGMVLSHGTWGTNSAIIVGAP